MIMMLILMMVSNGANDDKDDDSNDDNMVGNGARANGAENIVDDRYPAKANDILLIWTYSRYTHIIIYIII